MSAQLEQQLPREVDGDTILLDRPGACLVVVRGEVRLFAGAADDGLARRPVGRVGEGGLLFGVGVSMLGDETLIAVKSRNATIYELPDESWLRASPSEAFTAGLRLWLSAVVPGVARVIEPKPRVDVPLSAHHARIGVEPGQVIASHDALRWVRLQGEARLLGLESVHGLVPLPPGAWLTADSADLVHVLNDAAALAEDGWADELARFHEALVELLPLVRGLADADEFNRLRTRDQAQQHAQHETADRMAGIVGNPPGSRAPGTGEPLLDVMRIVAKTLDLRLQAPVRARQALVDRPATAQEIARASNVRLQPVKLKQDWWRVEAGALLGARVDGEPVALLYRAGGYDAVDRRGQVSRVTAETARDYRPQAHALFAPSRPGPVRLSSMLADSLRGSRRDILSYAATMLVAAVLAQVLPIATGFVLGVLAPAGMRSALAQIGLVIVLMAVAGYVAQLAGEVARHRVQARSNGLLYGALWDRVVSLPIQYFRKHGSAEVVARAGAAISVPSGVQVFLFTAAASIGMILSSAVSIALHHPVVALLALALACVQIISGVVAGNLQARTYLNGEQLQGLADSILLQTINGLIKLRSAGAEVRAVTRWADRFASMRARLVNARRVLNVYEAWMTALPLISVGVLFLVIQALNRGSQAALPVADVVAVLTAFSIMLTSVGQMTSGFVSVWLMAPSWKFAKPLLETVPEGNAGRTDPGLLHGDIEFSGVSFRYGDDGAPIFSGMSFRIAAGEMVAIVGPSGSGKSTLVRLALGLETPTSGAVYLDGQDLRSLQPSALRAQVGVVLQDTTLPPGTLLEIVRGSTEASVEDVWKALADAAIDREVAAMPMGLHTLLHDASRTLSGGQVQRLALARALLQRPELLILDEATSALDNATQARAMHAIRNLRATRMVIAHRISTVRHADRILVVSGGKIVEEGSYESLIAQDGVFAKLARL